MKTKSKTQKSEQPRSIKIEIEQGADSAHITWRVRVIVGDFAGEWNYHAVTNVEIKWHGKTPEANVVRQVKIEIVKRVWILNSLIGGGVAEVNANFAEVWSTFPDTNYRDGLAETIERFV
jgi:hypothetical protein